jgi:hypothetical protein
MGCEMGTQSDITLKENDLIRNEDIIISKIKVET